MAYTITVNGSDITYSVPLDSLTTDEAMGTLSTGSATLLDDPSDPLLGGLTDLEWAPVYVTDEDTSTVVFRGVLTNWDVTLASPSLRRVQLRFADPTIAMDHVYLGMVSGHYYGSWTYGAEPVPIDPDFYAWGFADVCAYAGIDVDTVVDPPSPWPDIAPAGFPPGLWDRTSVRQAVEFMAGLCGDPVVSYWFDHESGNLQVVTLPDPEAGTAPINFSQDPDDAMWVAAENVSVAHDASGFAESAYVNGATTFRSELLWDPAVFPDGDFVWTVIVGASGYHTLGGTTYENRQPGPMLMIDSGAVDWETSYAAADRALARSTKALIRGSLTRTGSEYAPSADPGRLKVGQAIGVDFPILGLPVAYYYVQRLSRRWLAGDGLHQTTVEFGDAPLARLTQRKQPTAAKAPTGAADPEVIAAQDVSLGPSASTTVTAQLKNLAGQPVATAGIAVHFDLRVKDAANVVVYDSASGYGSTDWTLDPSDTKSDTLGQATTTVTAGATPGQKGTVTAKMPGDAIVE